MTFLVLNTKHVCSLLSPSPYIHHCKNTLHHCTFSFITAHFVYHCTLEQASPATTNKCTSHILLNQSTNNKYNHYNLWCHPPVNQK